MRSECKVLSDTKCFLMDMDGTTTLGHQLLPGAKEWFCLLNAHHTPYIFLTNNSSKSRVEYAEQLNTLGLDVPEERIFTSGEATAIYLQKYYPGARLYIVGTPPLIRELAVHGFAVEEDNPDIAVLGFDTTLTYEKIWKLCTLVTAGKTYIATHPDINCPTEEGFKPDIGSMIELVAASTGRRPDVIVGKPYAPIVEVLAEKIGLPLDSLCMIGDRLYTDIALGQWGITTALVLSGETSRADLAVSNYKPDLVFEDIAELVASYRQTIVTGRGENPPC